LSAVVLAFSLFSASLDAQTYQPKANVVPQKLEQVPGYYRMMVGDYEVTALYDGYLSIGNGAYEPYTKLKPEQLKKLVDDEFRPLLSDGTINTAVTGYLINTGKNLVLIDAGSGDTYGTKIDKVGRLAESLKKAGYFPEQVDIILPTHLHFDHFSGVTRDGKMEFPNATIYVANEEKAFWLDTPVKDMPKNTQKYAQWVIDAITPYLNAGRVRYYNLNEEVIPNFKSIPTIGHTPGYGGFEITSKGETIFVWGDLLHNHALQLPYPEVAAEFDVNPKGARESRIAKLVEIAKRKIWVAGAHLPFPGFGHIIKKKGQYSWVPVEYIPIENK
jgi:beta-lactamase domain protein